MKQFLKSQGIIDGKTAGYSPQENGHAGRAIASLKTCMDGLLADSGLKDRYWAEALLHACYLLNTSSSTGGKSPWEQLKGKKPDASVLRVWGCKLGSLCLQSTGVNLLHLSPERVLSVDSWVLIIQI
jgi:hypothetical protein